ncbi:MAG: B12-binding domain-containing radical SAM protein [Dehalococcoidia bacterium]|jgi:radical SAM superfamily enzyme YgiQ (UPF0313 family)|nr:B12-binding domain-containing radical SAM protein [Dehalococcoidia bacterium]
MRVALIQPESPFLLDQAVHGPLGLWYLGAALRRAGHEPVYCDMGLGDALPDDCDVWCVTGTTPQRDCMEHVIRAAGSTPVIVGGPHASADPVDVLAMGDVTVVRGEGERVLPDLLTGPLPGAAIVNADRIRDLDALPFPDRSQAGRYHYQLRDRHGVEHAAATAITSRGCPHGCTFCSGGVWRRKYTARSAGNVIAEMWALRDRYTAVHFYDDSLAIDRKRLRVLCDGLRETELVWRCFVRADQVDAGTLRHMAGSGCVEIGLGVESGAQSVLDAIHKGETVQQQAACIQQAHDAGIRVKAFLIVGLPGESAYTIAQTEAFLKATRPDDIDVSVLQLYPGAPLYDLPLGLTVEGAGGWYKGKPGEYTCAHSTEWLRADEICDARDYLEAAYKGVRV